MPDDENGGGQIGGQAGDQALERPHATRRSTDYDDVLRRHRRCHASFGPQPPVSDTNPALFPGDQRYWRIEEIRKATDGNFALGDERFRRDLAAKLGRRVEPGKAGRRTKGPNVDEQLELL
jgi:hypothetical protein